jgi:sugar phosphate isomerase/epimerase
MRIGVCASYENWRAISDAGYDYIEGNLAELAGVSDEEFEEIRKIASSLPIKVETTNCFFPYGTVLYAYNPDGTTDVDGFKKIKESVGEYAVRALSRVRELGVKISIIGSGSSRTVPDGMKREAAEEQFTEILNLLGDIGAMYGVRLAVEPLQVSETNFVNTYAEGYALAKKLKHENVYTMIDFYHQARNGEPIDTFVSGGKELIHIHIASPGNRGAITESDLEYFSKHMEFLRDMGYKGRMSLESSHEPDFETSINATLPLMRKLAEVASNN